MIRVNLLPKDPGAKASRGDLSGAPGAPSNSLLVNFLIILILLGSFGGAGYWLYHTLEIFSQKKEELAGLKKDVEDLTKEEEARGEEYLALKKLEQSAIAKGGVLITLDPPDRIIWAEKLNMLSELRPEGVALTNIKLTETVEFLESMASIQAQKEWEEEVERIDEENKSITGRRKKKKPPKPKVVKVPYITQTLKIEGIAYQLTLTDRYRDISNMREALKSFFKVMPDKTIRHFMDGFEKNGLKRGDIVDIDNYQDSGRLVSQFSFEINTPRMGETDPEELLKRLSADLERRKRARATMDNPPQPIEAPATAPKASADTEEEESE